MSTKIRLYRAGWSPSASQCLIGFGDDGEFISTDAAFTTCKDDVYITSSGVEIQIVSWQPDGRGYSDRKVEK